MYHFSFRQNVPGGTSRASAKTSAPRVGVFASMASKRTIFPHIPTSLNISTSLKNKGALFQRPRLSISADAVDILYLCFETSHDGNVDDTPMVNLSRFIDTVEQSLSIFHNILGASRAAAIVGQIRYLDPDHGSTAARQYVSWPKLKELIETRTQLNFPVTAAALKERNEYASMLSASGVDIQTHTQTQPQPRLPHRGSATSGSVPVTASGAELISIRTTVSNNSASISQITPSASALGPSRSEHYRSIMSRLTSASALVPQGAGAGAGAGSGAGADHPVASRVEAMMVEASAGVGQRQELRAAHEELMRDKFTATATAMDVEDEEEDDEEDDEEDEEHHQAELQAFFDQLRAMRYWPLSEEEHNLVDGILRGPDNHEVVIDKFNVEMTRNKMLCLKPFTWLNDEVINFYMSMLKERDEALCAANPARLASWFFNSFFFAKLFGSENKYNYANVKRWSKKFDVFKMDKVIAPVNLGNTHWTLLCIYVQEKKIVYRDSMSGRGKKHLDAALQWIVDEARDKKGIANYDVSDWRLIDREPDVPQQMNGVDCGAFTVMCADFISDNLPLDYEQEDMPFFRRKIAADILRGSLRYTVQ